MCDMVFTCGTIEVDTTDFKVKTDKIFIGEAATIQNVPPQKVNMYFDDIVYENIVARQKKQKDCKCF